VPLVAGLGWVWLFGLLVGCLLACFLGFYRYKVITKNQSVGLWKVCVLCDAILEGFFYIQIWT